MPLSPNDLSFLRRTRLFEGFTLTEMGRFSPYIETRDYDMGQVVIWEGSRDRALYVLGSGSAVVTKVIRGDVESVLARLASGDHFGELSLIDGRAAAGSVSAESPCRVYSIDYDRLQQMVGDESPLFAKLTWRLLSDLAAKLRATNRKVQEAVEWGLDAASVDPND